MSAEQAEIIIRILQFQNALAFYTISLFFGLVCFIFGYKILNYLFK